MSALERTVERTEKVAFRMFLKPGQRAAYTQRHNDIWPDLSALLRASGITEYSIHLVEHSLVGGHQVLYATLRRAANHGMDDLPRHPVMQRWWAHMVDLMRTNPDGSPVVEVLPCVFHLD